MTWVMRGYRKNDHERRDASQRLNPFQFGLLHAHLRECFFSRVWLSFNDTQTTTTRTWVDHVAKR